MGSCCQTQYTSLSSTIEHNTIDMRWGGCELLLLGLPNSGKTKFTNLTKNMYLTNSQFIKNTDNIIYAKHKSGKFGGFNVLDMNTTNFSRLYEDNNAIQIISKAEYNIINDILFLKKFIQYIYNFNHTKLLTIPSEIIALIESFYINDNTIYIFRIDHIYDLCYNHLNEYKKGRIGKWMFDIYDISYNNYCKYYDDFWKFCYSGSYITMCNMRPSGILFIVSLLYYNQYDDQNMNLMSKSLELFKQIAENTTSETHVIVFFDEKKKFQKQIKKIPITVCKEFKDYKKIQLQSSIQYIQNYFETSSKLNLYIQYLHLHSGDISENNINEIWNKCIVPHFRPTDYTRNPHGDNSGIPWTL
eukprot:57301_1